MSALRKIYYIVSFILPITYMTMTFDGKEITSYVLWSSIIEFIVGIIMVASYDGPQGSELKTTLFGRPPILARCLSFAYGFTAVVMIFIQFNLGQYFR